MAQSKPVDSMSHHSSSGKSLIVVVLITLAIRAGVLICLPHGLTQDTDAYQRLAETLRTMGTFGFKATAVDAAPQQPVRPTAFRPPLYPFILSGLVLHGQLSLIEVGVFHVLCGVATVAMIWQLARSWGLERYGSAPALLLACDPILLYQSTQLMTETLAALLATMALGSLTYWRTRPTNTCAIVVGLLLGVACLCRPTFLPWSGLILLVCLLDNARISANNWTRMRAVTFVLVGLVAALFPWGLRNYLQFGHLKLTTTHGGYTLLLGNNPSYYRFLREEPWGSVWDSRELDEAWHQRDRLLSAQEDLFARSLSQSAANSSATALIVRNEQEDDRLAYDLARRYIREDPASFMVACLHRVVSLWQILPHRLHPNESPGRRWFRWLTACWYLSVYTLAVLGARQLGSRLLTPPWLWGLLLCVTFTAVHSLYWSNMRMRGPVMPFVALLAGAGIPAVVRNGRMKQ